MLGYENILDKSYPNTSTANLKTCQQMAVTNARCTPGLDSAARRS